MQQELELLGLVRMLRRQAGFVWGGIVVAVVLGVLALFLLKPVYTAAAVILVDPVQKNVLFSETVLGSNDDARVDSELELMSTDAVLIRVIDKLKLVSDPEFGVKIGLLPQTLALAGLPTPPLPTGPEAVNEVLANVREALNFQRRGGTYVISIVARGHSPEGAARLANGIAQAYITQQLAAKVSAVLASRDAIEGRMTDAENAVESSETAIDEFINRQINQLDEENAGVALLELRDRVARFETTTAMKTLALQEASAALADQDWEAVLSSLQSEALNELEVQRNALIQSLAGTPQNDNGHFDLRRQLDAVTENLKTETQNAIDALGEAITGEERQLGDLRMQLRDDVLRGPLSADALTNLYRLQKSAEGSRTQYSLLLSRVSELDAQASLQMPDSRIVSDALAPTEPSFPKPQVVLSFFAIAGLVLGCALALFIERYWGGFIDEDQLSSQVNRRVVSVVPKVPGGLSPKRLLETVALSPASAFSDAFQRMRIAIEQLNTYKPEVGKGQVVMITSTAPGEGKSTIAIGLARSCAIAGQRTILIDFDLRRPRILRYLGIKNLVTLAAILEGSRAVSPLPTPVLDPKSPAHIIGATPAVSMVVSSSTTRARLMQVVEECQKFYDVVILDTSPIGVVTDAAFIASVAHCVLFVVRWSLTPQMEVTRAMSQMQSSMLTEAEMLVVLNAQPSRLSQSSRYASYYAH